MTGCYPDRISMTKNFKPNSKTGLNPDEDTIADVLKEQAYASAAFGKWHLGDLPKFMPLDLGFDEFYGFP
ncbi:Sulfatase [Adhaeretor mobilis]|uniref:Sulfatase n=1 Tax=Adhaeretor mobilis TaxID=1930276 RepID=A0A517MXH5_9BACT|nr:Sulfatase [Adhaeretor mobilis]